MHRLVAGLVIAALLTACESVSTEYVSGDEPAHVAQDGSVVIEERAAAERLGLETSVLQQAQGTLVMPYAALHYGSDGGTWAYVKEEPLRFVRERVRVRGIEGNRVLLSDGPRPGTEVVTVGVPELWGIETGIADG
jgi:hypothetical protein